MTTATDAVPFEVAEADAAGRTKPFSTVAHEKTADHGVDGRTIREKADNQDERKARFERMALPARISMKARPATQALDKAECTTATTFAGQRSAFHFTCGAWGQEFPVEGIRLRLGQARPQVAAQERQAADATSDTWHLLQILEKRVTHSAERLLARERLNGDVFGEGLEPLPIGLHHGEGDMAGLASVDVTNDAGLPRMRTGDDQATVAIFGVLL
ncbi:hypothetical protein [Solimonas soli]|uniref:hypothetical protein n=1 Tax=Solimonas soli TaxID=413479 RepID=UPI0012F75FF8|nr:hypothetical protein [Solimonas soli]